MQKKPLVFTILAGLHLLTGLAGLIKFGFDLQGTLIAASALMSAFCIWRVTILALVAAPTFITVVINALFLHFYLRGYPLTIPLFFTAAFVIMHLPFLTPKIVTLFLHPDLRWWRRSERKKLVMPVVIKAFGDVEAELESFDISETGIFVPLFEQSDLAEHFAKQESFDITIGGAYQPQFHCCGRVARKSPATGIYPAGLGIQFVDLKREEKTKLRQILSPFAMSVFGSFPELPQ